MGQRVKNLPAMQKTWVRSLGQEGPLEKEMATHSSILAWRIPWTEEPGSLQSMGLQGRKQLKWLSTTALQYCVGFCHTSTWISHRYTYVFSLTLQPSSHLSCNPTLLGCHGALDLRSFGHTINFHWLSNFTCGNVCFKPTLSICPPSLPVSTSLFSLPVSTAALNTGSSVPSF